MKVKLSISKKYALYVSTLGLVLLTVMLISVGIIVWEGADTLREKLREGTKESYKINYEIMVINRARNFSYVIFNSLYRLDIESINRLIKNLKAEIPIKSALIAEASGKVLTDGTSENPSFGTKLAIDFSLLKSRQSLITHTTEGYKVAFTIALGDHVAGYGELLFSDDPLQSNIKQQDEMVVSMWKETREGFIGVALIGVLSIFLFMSFLGFLFSRKLTFPILKLRDATKRIAKGDLQHRLEIQSRDELGELADSFNRMAEELLKTTVSKNYVDNIIKNMNDSLIVVSPDGTIKTLNQATLNLLGYTEYELLNQPFGIIFEDKELASQWTGHIDLMKESSLIVRNIEKIYLSKDGRRIPVLFSSSVICDADGRIGGVVCMALDVTERKEAEEELRKHRQHLEELVEKRTIELTKANEKLQEEITERKRTEETLQENEEYLKILLNSIRTGIIVVDADTHKIADINPTALEMGGFNKEQILGLVCHQYICPAEIGKCPVTDLKQTVDVSERVLIKANGERIPILKSVVPIIRGGRRYLIESLIDITDWKQAEEAIKRSEEEAKRSAKENAIMSEIGQIVSSTLTIEEVYERFADEVHKLLPFDRIAINLTNPDKCTTTVAYTSGAEIPERLHGDIVLLTDTFTETVMRARMSQLIQGEENEIISRFPGLRFSLNVGLRSMMSVPLFSKDEVIGVLHIRSTKPNAYSERDLNLAERVGYQIAGAIANAKLFAERKKAEESLQKSEVVARRVAQENVIMAEIGRIISSSLNINEVYERFTKEVAKLISFDRIVINTVDIEKGTTATPYATGIDVPNRQIGISIPLAGTATEECFRKKLSMLIQPDDIDECIARFPGLLPSFQVGLRSIILTPLISKDQFIGALSLRSLIPKAYTDQDVRLTESIANQIAGAIANAQLFTERLRAEQKAKSLEEQLRQSQKIEAVGRLAGGIAHDFNNLLTVIKGYSELLLIKLKEGDPLKGNIEEIHRASLRAADLTRQLLAFSRRQILEFKVLDLNSILKDMDKMLHRILGEDIELVTLFAKGIGKVKTDPGQIEQVIMNLAINARDAMPSGGKLTIETANIELDETYARTHIGVRPGRYIMLSVSDTGVGMTLEVKEHIFEPFFTTKEKGKGTGLGLSTVYGIVKQSEGEVWCYSEPGQGTTFKIYLPRVEEEMSLLPRRDDKDSLPGGRETIFLVEDEPSVRGLAVQVLRESGYNLLQAANGTEALRVAQEYAGKIHLLLTDVVMPQMGGKELADRLKPLRPDIKVLFTSGYTDNAIVHHGVLGPGIEFLQKPFSPEALAQKVREVLDK